MKRITGLLPALVVLAGACAVSAGVEPVPSTSTTLAAAAAAVSPEPRATTSTSTSTTRPVTTTTTTSTATTSTTTTTVPVLDRSDAATIARMREDLAFLLGVGPRLSGTPAERLAAHWFTARSEEITGQPGRLQEFPLPERDPSANAWASAVGAGDRVLLIGAHLDTWVGSPGADDNASGVIVVLEMLRRLAEQPPAGLTVLVVGFGAEEWVGDHDHHFGSQVAAAEMEASGTLPDWMISVDMVGVAPRLQSVDFEGRFTSFADLIAEVGRSAGYRVARRTRGEISDHDSFAKVGVPAALMLRGVNLDYHTPADLNVREEALLETLAVLEAVIAHLDGGGG